MIVTGTLLSVAAVFSQQAGPAPEPNNIVPKEALDAAIYRALSSEAHPYPPPLVRGQKPTRFSLPPLHANVCAIPLLEAPVKPTHDGISRLKVAPRIDPKIVAAPPAPACPKR
jgi:hypothetical protein